MSWALYLVHEDADFTEYVASYTDEADAYAAQEKVDEELAQFDEDGEYPPVVIVVEEP